LDRGREATPTVKAIGRLPFRGTLVPDEFFEHITFDNGRPDLLAIMILSEIMYWYRPQAIKDPATGKLLGYAKKFTEDKLQRSYRALADKFGCSKRQATDAVTRLEKRGYLTREFRIVTAGRGMPVSNVLYLEPVSDEVAKLLNPTTSGTPLTLERDSPRVRTGERSRSRVIPPTLERETYTETSPENTPENTRRLSGGKRRASRRSPSPSRKRSSDSTEKRARTEPLTGPALEAVVKACDLDAELLSKKTEREIAEVLLKLRNKLGVNDDQLAGAISRFREWWSWGDWRGQKDEAPTPKSVLDCWPQFQRSVDDGFFDMVAECINDHGAN
jgi:hypothetical protein